ncbi:hypothetical protein C8Q75DRAFT_735537 [Abortiporus biennis]|nr:hypothetical protein C8Q75DRAFT_735537 [Abortiporus biennis]
MACKERPLQISRETFKKTNAAFERPYQGDKTVQCRDGNALMLASNSVSEKGWRCYIQGSNRMTFDIAQEGNSIVLFTMNCQSINNHESAVARKSRRSAVTWQYLNSVQARPRRLHRCGVHSMSALAKNPKFSSHFVIDKIGNGISEKNKNRLPIYTS